MDVDESIPDGRKEIVEGNVVAQYFHLIQVEVEMFVVFDLNHLQLMADHSEVLAVVVNLFKLKQNPNKKCVKI